MKCDVIYAMVCACCWGLLCIGCTKEDFVFSGNGGGGKCLERRLDLLLSEC